MAGKDIKILSSSGTEFDAYLAAPASGAGPGVVVAPAVHGINEGIRNFTGWVGVRTKSQDNIEE